MKQDYFMIFLQTKNVGIFEKSMEKDDLKKFLFLFFIKAVKKCASLCENFNISLIIVWI